MANYNYTCSDVKGEIIRGNTTAVSEPALRASLHEKGLLLIEAKEIKNAKGRLRLKPLELCEYCRELSTLLEAGVPLIRAIVIMSDRDIKPRVKRVYSEIYRNLQQGLSLSASMEELDGVFPHLLINMFKSAEASGNIDVTAKKMATYYEKNYRTAKKAMSAMIYPIILAIVTVLVLLIVFLFILPKFFEVFKNLEIELPLITRFMLNASIFISHNILWIAIGAVLLVMGIRYVLKIPKVKIAYDRTKLKLPIAGRLIRIICTARFARTISSLYSSGLTIMNAINNSKGTIGNQYIESQIDELMLNIRNGESFSTALSKVDGFDTKLASTVLIGEETGNLDNMLMSVADAFDYEMDMAMTKLVAMLEPIFIIVLAIIIGSIIISVMLPLTSLYSTIGTGA